jgi:hypothetical protein
VGNKTGSQTFALSVTGGTVVTDDYASMTVIDFSSAPAGLLSLTGDVTTSGSNVTTIAALKGLPVNTPTSPSTPAIGDVIYWDGEGYLAGPIRSSTPTPFFGHRLTVVSGNPVPDWGTSSTNLYFTQYQSDALWLNCGASDGDWQLKTFSELTCPLSIFNSVAGVYDIFLKYVSGTATFTAVAWNSGTGQRNSGVIGFNGFGIPVLIANAENRSRHLGTVYYNGTKLTDTSVDRLVCNPYNPVDRYFEYTPPGNLSWNHDISTWEYANNSSDSSVVLLVAPVATSIMTTVCAEALSLVRLMTDELEGMGAVGIGIDSTTTNSATIKHAYGIPTLAYSDQYGVAHASLNTTLSMGIHKLNWIEFASATAIYFYSTVLLNGSPFYHAGITGHICM